MDDAQHATDGTPRPEPSALEKSLVDHHARIFGYLVVLGADHAQAEEVIQEVAVSAAAARATVPDSALAWLLTTAQRRFVDLLRRTQVHRRHEQPVAELANAVEAALAETDDDEESSDSTFEITALRRCLGRLAPRAREIIELRYWQGLPSSDIAARIGWSDATVRVTLSKARRLLETCVREVVKLTSEPRDAR